MAAALPLSDEIVFSSPMPPSRPPEIQRKEFDDLANKAEESRKNVRRVEGDIGELKNRLTGVEKKLDSLITKKTLAIAVPIIGQAPLADLGYRAYGAFRTKPPSK